MARVSKIKLEGDQELKRKLEQLKGKARGALLDAAKAGAEPIQDDAQRDAPGGEPILIGNEKIDGGTAEVDIGFDEEKWFLRFFEFGATAHEITGSPIAFEGENGLVMTGKVDHPGMPAKPFLRPAADNNKDSARDAAGKVFKAEIDKLMESTNG